jgi:ribonucleoside-triphosphate reductase
MQSHGYLKGKQEKCAVCNAETEVYSRVVGYLRPVKQWNNGKQAEFSLRKSYKLPPDKSEDYNHVIQSEPDISQNESYFEAEPLRSLGAI